MRSIISTKLSLGSREAYPPGASVTGPGRVGKLYRLTVRLEVTDGLGIVHGTANRGSLSRTG